MQNSTVIKLKDLIFIQIGSIVCLPTLMLGHLLYLNGGLYNAIVTTVIGCTAVCILSSFQAKIAVRYRMDINHIITMVFGKNGMLILSLAILIASVGWFAVQLNLVTEAITYICSDRYVVPKTQCNILIGSLIFIAFFLGIHCIVKLADIITPIAIFVMLYILFVLFQNTNNVHIDIGHVKYDNILLTVASYIIGVLTTQNYYRFCTKEKDIHVANVISYIIFGILIQLLGVYIAIIRPDQNFMSSLVYNGNTFFKICIVTYVFMSAFIVNGINLYAGSLSLTSIAPFIKSYLNKFIVGFFAIFLACFDAIKHFELLLSCIGIFMIPVFAVMLFIGLLCGFKKFDAMGQMLQNYNIIGVVVGGLIGTLEYFHIINIFGIPFIGCIVSVFAVLIIYNIHRNVVKC